MSELQETIRELYRIVSRLEEQYPGRHFTLDGHLVGSLGEVVAEELYGLSLFKASVPTHDAQDSKGRLVQIKTTQKYKIGIGERPDYLIVLHILPDGFFEEVYNGPGAPAWDAAGKAMKNGQRQISLKRLREISEGFSDDERIRRKK